ncbi:MAG TPA: hypothetical protein DC047_02975 [Blastocatellia bacterium]|nr:hypothetical protein [Blastocatellia bacterium]
MIACTRAIILISTAESALAGIAALVPVGSAPELSPEELTTMTEYSAPGVYIEEVPFKSHPIEAVPTSTAAFIDIFEQGPIGKAVKIDSYADFERAFGGLHPRSEARRISTFTQVTFMVTRRPAVGTCNVR